MPDPRDLFELIRPRQWTKNLAAFAALLFSGELSHANQVGRSVLAFVALCLISAALYAANDTLDAERDRAHPVKRKRPVASGRVSARQAWMTSGLCLIAGLAVSGLLGVWFVAAVAFFMLMQVGYIVFFKHVVIVDMLVIALGFIIRAVAGAVAIATPVSPWLVLCTGLLALFLGSAKRRHEISLLGDGSARHRPVLAEYSVELLDNFMVTLSAATITSYALYTFFEPHGPQYAMMLTIPFVIYGVMRYQFLVLNRQGGGKPEDVLLSDRPIIASVLAWAGVAIVVIYILPLVVSKTTAG